MPPSSKTKSKTGSYDAVAYPGHPFAQSHPDRLATIATLLGLHPPPIDRCRVLELACGDGGNLIPMALALPEATFVGIDAAAQAIARGNQTISALGLRNIALHAGDLLKVDRSWGEFDYIITHGLYAWCPPAVRDAILRISSENLAADGVAYVSYNALPGGRLRQMLREMMLFHAGSFEDPMERARQARALLQLIAHGRTREDRFNALVRQEVERFSDRDLWFLFHDELAGVWEPVYLHQFLDHAAKHGLQYLAEAYLYDLQPGGLTADAQEALDALAEDDRVLRDQYFDFVLCRRFHHTLLCRENVPIHYPPAPERLESLFASTAATAVSGNPDLTEGVQEEFRGPLDSGMKTGHPVAKALLLALIEAAPQALSFAELAEKTGRGSELGQILLALSLAGLTDLHTARLPLVNTVSRRPVASPLARHQASHGGPLTTLTHSTLEIDEPWKLKLVTLLDGTRDRRALSRTLKIATGEVDRYLNQLARFGVLQA